MKIVLFSLISEKYVNRDTGAPYETWDCVTTNWSPRGYLYDGSPMPVELQLYNFGNAAVKGNINVIAPDNLILTPSEACVEIPPMDKKSVMLTVTADERLQSGSYTITVEGIFGGEKATPSVWQLFINK